jgi:hypothetical protein
MWKRLSYVCVFAVISWLGCGVAFADSNALKSGVAGNISVSPGCPGPQRIGQDCITPYADAQVLLLNATGEIVSRATTDNMGHFMMNASAGDYQIRVDISGLYPRCEAVSVRIPRKGYAQLDIMCDSGMR